MKLAFLNTHASTSAASKKEGKLSVRAIAVFSGLKGVHGVYNRQKLLFTWIVWQHKLPSSSKQTKDIYKPESVFHTSLRAVYSSHFSSVRDDLPASSQDRMATPNMTHVVLFKMPDTYSLTGEVGQSSGLVKLQFGVYSCIL